MLRGAHLVYTYYMSEHMRIDKQPLRNTPRTFLALLLGALAAEVPPAAAQTPTEQAQQVLPQTPGRKGVFMIPGWGGRAEDFSPLKESLSAQGVTVHVTDLPTMNAKERGVPEMTDEEFKAEIQILYRRFLSDNGLTPENTTVMGISFGAYLASHLAATENPSAVTLTALAVYPDGTLRAQEPMSQVFTPERYPALKQLRTQSGAVDTSVMGRLKGYRGHFLCIYGTEDKTTPPEIVVRHCTANEQPTIIEVHGAGHTLHGAERTEAHAFIENWLRDPAQALAGGLLTKK